MGDSISARISPRRRGGSRGRALAIGAVLGLTATAMGVAGAQSGDGGGGGSTVSAAAVPASQAEVFVGLSPVRVLDTRPTDGGPIGIGAGKLAAGQSIDLGLVGPGKPLPAEATSAVLNVTLDQDASLKSFLTIWPAGQGRPNASANNAEPGFVAANSMIAKLGTGGAVSIFNQQGETNVIIDVVGYLLPADQVTGLGSQFLVDAGPPASGVGGTGDMYFDTATNDLYGPRSDSGWGGPVANLGGGASTATFTPVDGSPCSPSGSSSFNTTDGEISLCVGGVWEGPVAIRSTIDGETSYDDESIVPVDLADTLFTPVTSFSAPANGSYILDGSLTVNQSVAASWPSFSNLECRWVDSLGTHRRAVVQARHFLLSSDVPFPNCASLAPMAPDEPCRRTET